MTQIYHQALAESYTGAIQNQLIIENMRKINVMQPQISRPRNMPLPIQEIRLGGLHCVMHKFVVCIMSCVITR